MTIDDAIGQLVAIGSRTSGFNHDIASKIQGVMMALDEIVELSKDADIQRAAETAQTALGELNQLLQQNRALTKPPVKSQADLGELITKAAARVGVTLKGMRPAGTVEVAIPLMTQALALAIDVAAGAERRRSIEIGWRAGNGIELELPLSANTVADPEVPLAIAGWIIKRDGGELVRGERALTVRLPS